ncbi:MAG: inositol monophosphatase [Candidatus Zixiibacteriota bacterium]|nr:MAG: inositol monophosphatase [candidate division Zixibacteria bacterium]
MLSRKEKRQLRTFAEETARGAGKLLRRGFMRSKKVTLKGRIDPVTQYDLKSEKYITSRIRRSWPDHDILTEEGNSKRSESAFCWVIDPLDGTVNYAHGFPVYCVSIGLQYNERPVLGAVYDPERNEMFSAAVGMGASLNGRRIGVSSERRIERALLATGFAYNIGTAERNNLGLFARMAKLAQGVRRPGSAAIDLCWLAAGRIDGFWELYLHPWDTAAAVVIVEEAGGEVTQINGRPYSIFDDDLLAANAGLRRTMQAALSPADRT